MPPGLCVDGDAGVIGRVTRPCLSLGTVHDEDAIAIDLKGEQHAPPQGLRLSCYHACRHQLARCGCCSSPLQQAMTLSTHWPSYTSIFLQPSPTSPSSVDIRAGVMYGTQCTSLPSTLALVTMRGAQAHVEAMLGDVVRTTVAHDDTQKATGELCIIFQFHVLILFARRHSLRTSCARSLFTPTLQTPQATLDRPFSLHAFRLLLRKIRCK